jgi:hypothetical protein
MLLHRRAATNPIDQTNEGGHNGRLRGGGSSAVAGGWTAGTAVPRVARGEKKKKVMRPSLMRFFVSKKKKSKR